VSVRRKRAFDSRLKDNGRYDRHEIALDVRSRKLCENDFHGNEKNFQNSMKHWMEMEGNESREKGKMEIVNE
jgi:hypothetical protein